MISKSHGVLALAIGLACGFVLGRTTHPASGKAYEAADVNEGVSEQLFLDLSDRFAQVSQKPASEQTYDEQRFIQDATSEYRVQCLPALKPEVRSFCSQMGELVPAYNDRNTADRLSRAVSP